MNGLQPYVAIMLCTRIVTAHDTACDSSDASSDEASFLQKAITAHHQALISPQSAEPRFGSQDCPCIGIDGMKGFKKVKSGDRFPASLGAHCDAWDKKDGKKDAWRDEKWCY